MSDTFICAYALNGDGSGTPVTEDWLGSAGPDSKPFWAHLSARSEAARHWLHHRANLPETIVDALLAEDTRPRLLATEHGLLLILRGVNLNENADPEDMVSIRIWIEAHRFISVQLRNLRGVADMRSGLEAGTGATDIGDLITRFIEGSIVRISPVMSAVADGIDEVEDLVINRQLSGVRDQIIDIRRKTIIFYRFLVPQRDIVQQLCETPLAWLTQSDRARLRECQNEITRVVEDLQAMRERAHSVQEEISNVLTERLNRNTYMLSIIAAIFLPLSFLTGLLGINVPGIPGADDPEAFLVFCGILLVVIVFQVGLFKRLRWF